MRIQLAAFATAALLLIAAGCTREGPETAAANLAATDASPAMPTTSATPATSPTEIAAMPASAMTTKPPPINPAPEQAGSFRSDPGLGTGVGHPVAASDALTTTQKQPEIISTDQSDKSCHTDADCAIKDVGSCCGYNPRCVNRDTPTFPEQVKAQCSKDGRASICGFPALSGCRCEQGTCAGISAGAVVR